MHVRNSVTHIATEMLLTYSLQTYHVSQLFYAQSFIRFRPYHLSLCLSVLLCHRFRIYQLRDVPCFFIYFYTVFAEHALCDQINVGMQAPAAK